MYQELLISLTAQATHSLGKKPVYNNIRYVNRRRFMLLLGKVTEYVLCFFTLFDGACNFAAEIWRVSAHVDLSTFRGLSWRTYFASESKHSLTKATSKSFYVWPDSYVNNAYDKFFKMRDDQRTLMSNHKN